MKEHSRNLHWKRSHSLALSRRWTTGFWGLRKYCFQKQHFFLTKKQRLSNQSVGRPKQNKLCRYLQCRRKTLKFQSPWAPEVLLNAKSHQKPTAEPSTFPAKTSRRTRRCYYHGKTRNPSIEALKELDNESFQGEDLLSTGLQTNTGFNSFQGNGPSACCGELCGAASPVKKDGLAHVGEDSSYDEGNTVLVVLNNCKRKPCCKGLEQNGTCGPLTTQKRSKFNQYIVQKRSLFMMHKKLSMPRLWYRVVKSPTGRARGKICKSSKAKPSWVEKVTRDCQETLQENSKRAWCSWLSCWISKSHPLWNLYSSSDMNNNTPESVAEENETHTSDICLTQDALQCNELFSEELASGDQDGSVKICQPELHEAAPLVDTETLQGVESEEVPAVDGCHDDDFFISVTEKEIAISGQEDIDSDQIMGIDGTISLESYKEDSSTNENGPFFMELAQNEDSCSQMEVESSLNLDIFSSKLLDHPYCKSPLEEPLPESTGLKSGTRKGSKRNSQKASHVADEQLAAWLCGFLDEVMKKYGSLVPLCEKDVMGKLKEAFNEDFSHRKPFITKEIMNYRAKHPKSSTCNFRVFYNKHMLDMDDLATLDGQNWLNDQIINMYGELIMDAVPDKVHFFNSFFHRQLVTKGYNGVKRWTKKVDLFKKTLLLIPIHLEVHWSLITVNIPNRIISFYDSQGIHFKFCVENIRKYLLTEAKEKNHPEFLQGWQTAVTKCIPQQKNDSDCGVFVLQYCKCLALDQPFQFSQEDMPRVRKRIYKELCERQLID
ncbi:PREDICTED: sentrin-specific protease 2 isoform X2 [Gavialis gangeticus]|uniref:sentrin-specific protease 2 isoform X2 n=1 Tax=Gavialis gangeticus TaxID=94835 RepID=UPI00092F6425|nr:PREDICTED: sentrin-specific protease 2 isoform X2 [Gavialis gangeticus]